MTDYRLISQQYAQGGINAAILVNGGAAVALLSQAADFAGAGLASTVRWAMIVWAIGVLMGAAAWPCAFLSTRYVDKGDRESGLKQQHLDTSNLFMHLALAAVTASLIFFAVGSLALAWSFGSAGVGAPP